MARPSIAAAILRVGVVLAPIAGLAACSSLLGDFSIGDANDASLPDSTSDAGVTDSATRADADAAPSNDSGSDAVAALDGCAKTACGAECVDTANDPKNCGACGHDCTGLQHVALAVGVKCDNGVCHVPASACATDYAHCTTVADDGCETNVATTDHCRSCNTKCAPGEVCTESGCASTCPTGTTLCGTTCANTDKDPAHCGDCATSCPQPALGGNATCVNRSCGIACVGGWHQCNADPVCASDTDPAHCTSNCLRCDAPPGASPTCSATGCGFVCGPGTANCGGACVSCPIGGSCIGTACACTNGQTACGGTCVTCPAGGVCSGTSCVCPNTAPVVCNGGCVSTSDDPKHCGGCNKPCASGICFGGNCAVCKAGDTQCSTCPNNSANDCIMGCNAAHTGYTDIVRDCGIAQHGGISDSCDPSGGPHCI